MRRRELLAAAAALGCAVPANLRAVEQPSLRVATIPSDTGSDVYYAQDQGFFKAAGLDVQIDSISNGPDIIAGITGGSYQAGAANTVSIAAAREHGVAITIIAPGAVHEHGVPTDQLMVGKDSPLRTARDLNGKTIAVTTLSGLGTVAIKAWITKNGGDLQSVHFVEVHYPAMAAALQAGRIDVAMMTEPFITASKGQVRSLADTYDAIAERFLIDGWVASDSWAQQHPDEVRRFATAMRNANAWANAHQRESAAILIRYAKLDPDLAGGMARAGFSTTLDPQLVQPLLDAASRFGMLDRPLPAANIIFSPGSG